MRAGSQQRGGLALVMGEQSLEDQVLIQGLLLEICETLKSLLKVLASQFHHFSFFLLLWLDRVFVAAHAMVDRPCSMWHL